MLGVVLLVIGMNVFQSPKERRLRREMAAMERQVRKMSETVKRNESVLRDLENREPSFCGGARPPIPELPVGRLSTGSSG